MKTIEELASNTINESEIYDNIISKLLEAKNNGTPINEGLFTSLFAGAAAATVGPTVMKAVCDCLGVDIKGPLGSLMTSRLILTAMAAKLGWRA